MDNIPCSAQEYRRWWEENTDVHYGFCWCGCGERTTLAIQTTRRYLHFKGAPVRFIRGHGARRGSIDYIIEDRDYTTPCWIWQRCTDRNGYGTKQFRGRHTTAHRAYYEIIHGPIPEGLTLDHLCRVRNCVNPSHLEPVTQGENARRGSQSKLTQAKADEIRVLHASGVSAKEIAPLFGIKRDSVYGVVNRRSWLS